MAYYSQWCKGRPVRRLTWVCGPEHVLVHDVVEHYRSQSGEQVTLTAGDDADRDIWAACSQLPADPDATRLVLVRSSQKLRGWDDMRSLVQARDLGTVRVLWHSDDADFARVPGEPGELAPYLALLRGYRSGQLIRCVAPDAGGSFPEWVIAWAGELLGGAGPVLGSYLLAASGDDIPEAANIAAKLRAASIAASRESIDVLADPAADFAEAVVAGRRAAALAAADVMSRADMGRTIGLLDKRLDILAALHQAVLQKLDSRDIAVRHGILQPLQSRYKTLSKGYGPQRVSTCRTALAVADAAWRSGITEGVAEVLAVLWGS